MWTEPAFCIGNSTGSGCGDGGTCIPGGHACVCEPPYIHDAFWMQFPNCGFTDATRDIMFVVLVCLTILAFAWAAFHLPYTRNNYIASTLCSIAILMSIIQLIFLLFIYFSVEVVFMLTCYMMLYFIQLAVTIPLIYWSCVHPLFTLTYKHGLRDRIRWWLRIHAVVVFIFTFALYIVQLSVLSTNIPLWNYFQSIWLITVSLYISIESWTCWFYADKLCSLIPDKNHIQYTLSSRVCMLNAATTPICFLTGFIYLQSGPFVGAFILGFGLHIQPILHSVILVMYARRLRDIQREVTTADIQMPVHLDTTLQEPAV